VIEGPRKLRAQRTMARILTFAHALTIVQKGKELDHQQISLSYLAHL
jgi:hypothetical protein